MKHRVLIVIACLVLAAVAVARADRYEEPVNRLSFAVFPMQIGEWQGRQHPPFADNILAVLGLDDYLTRTYYTPSGPGANIYVGYWKSQRQGDAIHSPQNCLPGAGWEPVSQTMLPIPDPRPGRSGNVEVNRFVIRKGIDRQLVLYWYQSHGRIIGNEYWSKIYLVTDAVRLNRTDAALVRIIVPIIGPGADAEAAAEQQAVKFTTALLPALTPFVPE